MSKIESEGDYPLHLIRPVDIRLARFRFGAERPVDRDWGPDQRRPGGLDAGAVMRGEQIV